MVLRRRVLTPPNFFSISRSETPAAPGPPVRTAVVRYSDLSEPVIHCGQRKQTFRTEIAPSIQRNAYLLQSIDDKELAIIRKYGRGLEVLDVRSSRRFRDRQANLVVAFADVGDNTLLQFGRSKVDDGREADSNTTTDAAQRATRADLPELVAERNVVERVNLVGLESTRDREVGAEVFVDLRTEM